MNTTSLRTEADSLKSVLLCHLSLVCILLLPCFGEVLLRTPLEKEGGKHVRIVAYHFQADARTLIATLRYLLAPESDIEFAPAAISGTAAFTIKAPQQPFETFAYSSNQTEIASEPSTNRPARS